MMLFKIIPTFATFAFCSVAIIAAPTGDAQASSLMKKATPQGLPQIFGDATQSMIPLTQQLQSLGPNDMTTEKVTPIVNNMKTVLNGVITNVKGLQGQPASVVFARSEASPSSTTGSAPSGASSPVEAVVAIISQLLRVSYIHSHIQTDALGAVLAILTSNPSAASADVHQLLVEVGQLLETVISTVVSVLGSLLPGIGPLLGSLLSDLGSIITNLGLTLLGQILGLLL
ncbi:hypothetical protein BDY19DRAFT_724152 [Irpex rosettiformis]|uniref:Uncharacterized protein n=1 Tax=Irpex rosettiformis TaxID=378272 RepID=A0ACB8U8I7_9APHY|nr:hypothetical protein BDY19DRAFT_724152 [Irpex rosettiformis]